MKSSYVSECTRLDVFNHSHVPCDILTRWQNELFWLSERQSHGVKREEVWCHEQDGEESDGWLTLTGAHVTTGLEENSCLLIRAHHTLLNLRVERTEWFRVARYTACKLQPCCEVGVWYLSSGLDLFLANETFLDTGRAERAGGDVTAGAEERVSLHIRANHAFLKSLVITV